MRGWLRTDRVEDIPEHGSDTLNRHRLPDFVDGHARRVEGQSECYRRTDADFALDGEGAPVKFHQPAAQGQSEAGSGRFVAELTVGLLERLRQLRQVLF